LLMSHLGVVLSLVLRLALGVVLLLVLRLVPRLALLLVGGGTLLLLNRVVDGLALQKERVIRGPIETPQAKPTAVAAPASG